MLVVLCTRMLVKKMSCITMYIYILLYVSRECSGQHVNYISDPMTHSEARGNCDLVKLLDQNSRNIILEMSNSLAPAPKLAWVNGYVSFTEWITFNGCLSFNLTVIKPNLQRIPTGSNDAILFCYQRCYPLTFALYDDYCVCMNRNFSRQNHLFCQDFILIDKIGIVGAKRRNNNACICTYYPRQENTATLNERIGRQENAATLRENIGHAQCLTLQHFYGKNLSIRSEDCNSKWYFFCYNNRTSSYTFNSNVKEKKAFWQAAQHCQELSTYFSFKYNDNFAVTISSDVFWGSSFRRYILHLNMSDHSSSMLCAAVAPEADGSFEIVPMPCTDRLPGFCSNDVSLSTVVIVVICLGVVIAICSCFAILFIFLKRYTRSVSDTKAKDAHLKEDVTKKRPKIELYVFNEVADIPQVESSGVYNVLHQKNTSDNRSKPELYDHIPGGAANTKSDDDYDLMCGKVKCVDLLVESTDYDSVQYRPEMDNSHINKHYDHFELKNDKQKSQICSEYDHVVHIIPEK